LAITEEELALLRIRDFAVLPFIVSQQVINGRTQDAIGEAAQSIIRRSGVKRAAQLLRLG
jgi:hypothetical protein